MYRHYAPAYGPLKGDGARRLGGRWNPPDSFAVLYTGTDLATVDAEFAHQLALVRLKPDAVRPRELATIRIELHRVLDLRESSVRVALGVRLEDLLANDPALPRAIGEAAHHLGYEAVVAPSAAPGGADVVAIFLTNRAADSLIELVAVEPYQRT